MSIILQNKPFRFCVIKNNKTVLIKYADSIEMPKNLVTDGDLFYIYV